MTDLSLGGTLEYIDRTCGHDVSGGSRLYHRQWKAGPVELIGELVTVGQNTGILLVQPTLSPLVPYQVQTTVLYFSTRTS